MSQVDENLLNYKMMEFLRFVRDRKPQSQKEILTSSAGSPLARAGG